LPFTSFPPQVSHLHRQERLQHTSTHAAASSSSASVGWLIESRACLPPSPSGQTSRTPPTRFATTEPTSLSPSLNTSYAVRRSSRLGSMSKFWKVCTAIRFQNSVLRRLLRPRRGSAPLSDDEPPFLI
ncbi:hypothetical protein LZ31DRAFT_616009, partial [Colletotrichum somersetense]